MFKTYFKILLLGHVLGDFYFQSEQLARQKDSEILCVLKHSAYYLVGMIMVHVLIMNCEILVIAVIASMLHFVIDGVKFYYICNKNEKTSKTRKFERNVFGVDQCLHLVSLFWLAYFVQKSDTVVQIRNIFADVFEVMEISEQQLLQWTLAILILHKPCNITIQKILSVYKNTDKTIGQESDIQQAGRYIGTLERIITLVFLAVQQFAAIGLVMTAKSIARFEKISKDQNFAEYYLLGTLLSILLSIVIFYVLLC